MVLKHCSRFYYSVLVKVEIYALCELVPWWIYTIGSSSLFCTRRVSQLVGFLPNSQYLTLSEQFLMKNLNHSSFVHCNIVDNFVHCSIETLRESASTDQTKKEPSMMDKCLSCYKEFYVTFVCVIRLKLGETRSINSLFQSLSIKSTEMAAKDKAKCLERLLSRILRCNGSSLYSDLLTSSSANESSCCSCKSRNGYCCCTLYSLKETVGLEWQDPVSQASKLLIELSTFQTSVLSNASFKSKFAIFVCSCWCFVTICEFLCADSPLMNDWESLPDWLISLIVCSCWLGNSCIPLQLVAISTLLDLAFLCCRAESYAKHTMLRDGGEMISSDSIPNQTMPIVFVPLLTFSQLSFIEQRTNVFQVCFNLFNTQRTRSPR